MFIRSQLYKKLICFPQFLEKEKIYTSEAVFFKNKDLLLEFLNFNLLFDESVFYIHNNYENRFWLYNDCSEKNYSFCFKATSSAISLFKKNFFYSQSFLHIFNSRKFLLKDFSREKVIPLRLHGLSKAGYIVSFYGSKAVVNTSFFYNDFNKIHNYFFWYLINIKFIGLLDFFSVLNWSIHYFNNSKKFKNDKKSFFYFQKGCIIGSKTIFKKINL